MRGMQLDFFSKLNAAARRAFGTQKPTAPVLAVEEDPWQTQARILLKSIGCAELAARVAVRWNARMRSTAGTAFPGKALVHLNPRLREFGDSEIDRTLRHELAHLLAYHRAGRRRILPHGTEWRAACLELGLADEKRCHDLPLPRRTFRASHRYRCLHCGQELKRVRPLRRKSACLSCCRAHNRGHYDERFRFVKLPVHA
jgi:predicted SprT family Zn-dependent metalloprotease